VILYAYRIGLIVRLPNSNTSEKCGVCIGWFDESDKDKLPKSAFAY